VSWLTTINAAELNNEWHSTRRIQLRVSGGLTPSPGALKNSATCYDQPLAIRPVASGSKEM